MLLFASINAYSISDEVAFECLKVRISKEEAAQLFDLAQERLNGLTKMDIAELKALKVCPAPIELALEVVAVLLQKPHSGWEDAKKMMEDEKVGIFVEIVKARGSL